MSFATFEADVYEALSLLLATVPEVPPAHEWRLENVGSTPPQTPQTWLRVGFGPGPRRKVELGTTDPLFRGTGVFFVDLFFVPDLGMAERNTVVGGILAVLHPGAYATAPNGQVVRITRAYASRRENEGNWYHVPVTIEWRADVTQLAA